MSVITSTPMPKLAPTDIVKLRNGRYGIVLYNTMSENLLSIFTYYKNEDGISCCEHLYRYNKNINMTDHSLDIVAVWKSNVETQFKCVHSFFYNKKAPEYLDPTWTEPKGNKYCLIRVSQTTSHTYAVKANNYDEAMKAEDEIRERFRNLDMELSIDDCDGTEFEIARTGLTKEEIEKGCYDIYTMKGADANE